MSEIPLHAFFIHFPIALFVLETFLLLLVWIQKRSEYFQFAKLVFLLAWIALIPTVVSGVVWAGGIQAAWKGMTHNHFLSALITFIIQSTRWVAWRKFPQGFYWLHLVLSGIGTGLILLTGHLGATLVYG